LIEEYLWDEIHEKIVRNRRNDKDRANFFWFQNPNDQLMGGLYMHIRVSEGLPNTDINFSGEIQNWEFYDIDELLVEENSKLWSATRNILEYIQSSRQSILKIAWEFNELRNTLSDKWGIVDKKRKETITDLIDSIPGIENFSWNEWWRLADLFLSWEWEYLSEKNSIYELLRLGAQVWKIKIISQVIEASDVDQMSRIYNPLRFQVL
jgi:hypothetical protein